ncbi:MAG: hypothetical protein JNM93_02905 [Bacteriovoracaceae bacterium]|nr:hypothetical protein [Bacteriovoracaceae bacterium]
MSTNPRQPILDFMQSIHSQGVDCQSCVGHCCTSIANSMQITVQETWDIYSYLQKNHLMNEELIQKLKDNVTQFRLDKDLSLGKKSILRRTYTCPFYNGHNLGCQLPTEIKPYGCLAFNPATEAVSEVGHCRSEVAALEACDVQAKARNVELQAKLGVTWDKKPIPVALLDFHMRKISVELH